MHSVELYLIALGLSFDTFAVSISTGLTVARIRFWQATKVALVLALFQGGMPLFGWLGGTQIAHYISHVDHWVAFGLLTALGLKMCIDAFHKREQWTVNPLAWSVLLGMAVVTSVDALVVGVSFAFLDINIYWAVSVIGTVTYVVAMLGMLFGKASNGRFGRQVERVGGFILISIGLKILFSHLGSG